MNNRDRERPTDAQSGASLAQVALVLGCISVVLFPVGLGGVLFGIAALQSQGPRLKSALAIVLSLLTMAAGVSIVGGDVLRFKVRAKQAECKAHLARALERSARFWRRPAATRRARWRSASP